MNAGNQSLDFMGLLRLIGHYRNEKKVAIVVSFYVSSTSIGFFGGGVIEETNSQPRR